MSPWLELSGYSVVIVLGAVAGAVVPVLTRRDRPLVALLAFAAGVMFGAAFFHMMPEAFHAGGFKAFAWAPVGFALLFLLERYVFTHSCEELDCEDHGHPELTSGAPAGAARPHRAEALGTTAFVGLALHTLFDGVALGSAVTGGVGLMVFVAILAHKVPSSLSLASILRHEGRSRGGTLAAATVYGLMVPAGALLYFALDQVIDFAGFTAGVLAFSAGTFLYIAVSDLLPHMNRHWKSGRAANVLGLVGGLVLMFALTWLTAHDHGPVPH